MHVILSAQFLCLFVNL